MNVMFQGVQAFQGSKAAVTSKLDEVGEEHAFGFNAHLTDYDGSTVGYYISGEDARQLLNDAFDVNVPSDLLTKSQEEVQADASLMKTVLGFLPKLQEIFSEDNIEATMGKITDFGKQAVDRGVDAEGKAVVVQDV